MVEVISDTNIALSIATAVDIGRARKIARRNLDNTSHKQPALERELHLAMTKIDRETTGRGVVAADEIGAEITVTAGVAADQIRMASRIFLQVIQRAANRQLELTTQAQTSELRNLRTRIPEHANRALNSSVIDRTTGNPHRQIISR